MRKIIISIGIFYTLMACKNVNNEKQLSGMVIPSVQKEKEQIKADRIIDKLIQAHGGALYETADYSFVFRKKKYRFTNKNNEYIYSVTQEKEGHVIKDFITNGKFERFVNGQQINMSNRQIEAAKGALNSVIYFATLPHKLKDASVNKKFIENTVIKNENYDLIEVTFDEQGGGKDHDDEFHYWINQKTNKIDYLAYNYRVNNGGVRFRSFYNRRVIDGVTFQDYVNWKADLGTPLKELPVLFEQERLKELSRIETESIVNMKTK